MAEDSAALVDTESAPSIDMDKAVDQISADLFPEPPEKDTTPQDTVATALAEPKEPVTTPTKTVPPLPTVRPAPKSWAKDVHPLWEKIDPKAQEYIEKREKDFLDGNQQYRDAAAQSAEVQKVLAPYQPLLQSKGLNAPQAIDDLLRTYHGLTQGTMEQRQAVLKQVATNLGIAIQATTANGTPNGTDPTPSIDPRIQTIEQQLQEMRDIQTAQQRAALQAAQEKASAEVNAFVSEVNKDGSPVHAFFDECYEDIVKLLKVGESLQDAYDKAVWANPVTREKSKLAYFQTESEKAKERARLEALPKQKARGVNVRSQDTQRSPTEPLGSMDDTLRSAYKDIKAKTVH